LKYIGFNRKGYQLRDCLRPRDLISILRQQMDAPSGKNRICNLGGRVTNRMSLAQLTAWCATCFGPREIAADPSPHPFDIPRDGARYRAGGKGMGLAVQNAFRKNPLRNCRHAVKHPNWLELSGP